MPRQAPSAVSTGGQLNLSYLVPTQQFVLLADRRVGVDLNPILSDWRLDPACSCFRLSGAGGEDADRVSRDRVVIS